MCCPPPPPKIGHCRHCHQCLQVVIAHQLPPHCRHHHGRLQAVPTWPALAANVTRPLGLPSPPTLPWPPAGGPRSACLHCHHHCGRLWVVPACHAPATASTTCGQLPCPCRLRKHPSSTVCYSCTPLWIILDLPLHEVQKPNSQYWRGANGTLKASLKVKRIFLLRRGI